MDLASSLFSRVGVDRSQIRKRPKNNVARTFDNCLAPLGIRLSNEERKLKSGLYECVTLVSSERTTSYRFGTFSTEELESLLVLEVPRKVHDYVPSIAPIAGATGAEAVADKVVGKSKGKKGASEGKKVGRGRGGGSGLFGRKATSTIDDAFVKEETSHDVEDAMARKRARMGGGEGVGEDNIYRDNDDLEFTAIMEKPLPSNFYEVVNAVFLEFWNIDFDDASLAPAFFARIEASNCRDYGLTAFAETSSCLVVIRDRLEATLQSLRSGGAAPPLSSTRGGGGSASGNLGVGGGIGFKPYRSVEDFFTDFRQMFENIFTYYPQGSAVFNKATELNAHFLRRWDAAKMTFK